ncbi:MAG: oligosaccharide flippase family protein [Faecalibacterium sp.]
MRQSYFKNAALLTGSDVLLRLAGMGLRIYLANVLGGEGMGLYQLVLAVYSLFVTLATAGVSVAATRLMTEELSRGRSTARGMLTRLIAAALGLGTLALAGQFGLAGLAAKWWLGDERAAAALRVSALGLPWMAVSAVLRGFFLARRRVEPNVVSQLVEQGFRAAVMVAALERTESWDVSARCAVVLAATAASEMLSTCMMLLFARAETRRCFGAEPARSPQDPARRLWEILWPVEGGRCLSSALHTAENMLVPACLAVYLADAGGRSEAVTQYGNLKGMALPLLTFPFGLLGSLSVLLMPEITQAHISGQTDRLRALLDRMLRLTGYVSALVGALFCVWGRPLALALYDSAEAGFYLQVLGPAMPLMYLESMVDGAMKGIGEQKAIFRYSVWDSILRISGVILLLPRFGMKGFLFVILISSLYTCCANTRRLLESCGMKTALMRWMGAPALAAAIAAAAGLVLRQALGGLLSGGRWMQLAALALGGTGTAAVCAAVAWPMGMGREVRAILDAQRGRNAGSDRRKATSAGKSGQQGTE